MKPTARSQMGRASETDQTLRFAVTSASLRQRLRGRSGFSNLWLIVGIAVASILPVAAQMTVEVALEQEQFLGGEALPAAVRITNLSGQTLHLGTEPDWLTFLVESRD